VKIVVAQPGKQHTHLLLQALERKGYLQRFFTVFAANSTQWLWPVLPNIITNELKKRLFSGVSRRLIKHKARLFAKEKLVRINSEAQLIKTVYEPFDIWVAGQLPTLQPDILIGYENANVASFKKAKSLGITTVLDLAQIHHNSIVEIHQRYGFLNSSYSPEVLQYINSRKEEALAYSDYILTLSTFARDSLVNNGVPPEKIFTVHLGINQQLFYPKPTYATDAPFRFLFVGTITRRKGLKTLLEAFKQLQLPDAELVLVGPMADGKALLASYDGLFTYIPFLHHEALAKQYRAADVFVFPSYLDSWAQTVVEAMACGTPAIVSEHTGAKDAVVQGGGFVIPPGDVAALKEQMLYCYQNRDAVSALGERAAQIASQYTVANYHAQVIKALEQIRHEQDNS
jgi:glycosyltransferase involved in cell wall biosynthesis